MARDKRPNVALRDISRRFAQVLHELDLSPATAAERLGYSTPATLYSVLAGRCLPDISRLATLACLQSRSGRYINLHWLITGAGEAFLERSEDTSDVRLQELVSNLPDYKKRALATIMS